MELATASGPTAAPTAASPPGPLHLYSDDLMALLTLAAACLVVFCCAARFKKEARSPFAAGSWWTRSVAGLLAMLLLVLVIGALLNRVRGGWRPFGGHAGVSWLQVRPAL